MHPAVRCGKKDEPGPVTVSSEPGPVTGTRQLAVHATAAKQARSTTPHLGPTERASQVSPSLPTLGLRRSQNLKDTEACDQRAPLSLCWGRLGHSGWLDQLLFPGRCSWPLVSVPPVRVSPSRCRAAPPWLALVCLYWLIPGEPLPVGSLAWQPSVLFAHRSQQWNKQTWKSEGEMAD